MHDLSDRPSPSRASGTVGDPAARHPAALQLAREWQRSRRRPDHLRHIACWGVVHLELTDLDDLVRLTSPDDTEADVLLRRLVEVARHDDLAARIVVQRLLPDLERVHRRRRFRYRSEVDFGDLLSTTWAAIRTYDPGRRPSRIARALVDDVEYREYRAPFRRLGRPLPADPSRFDELVGADVSAASDELEAVLADAGPLEAHEHDLLNRLLSGRMAIDIARELDVTPRTVRNRRDRLVGKLREVSLAA
jgi:DNA-binding CsgD family transcriptional regulator